MTGGATPRWYRVLSLVTLIGVAGFCAFVAWLGQHRYHDPTRFFYEFRTAGHPGIVNVIGSMGFGVVAIILLILTLVEDSPDRNTLLGGTALFVLLTTDTLVRLHNHVPGGDVAFRIVFWVGGGVLVYRLAPMLRPVPVGAWMMLMSAAALLVTSELSDLLGSGDRWSVFEESTACVGACCLASFSVECGAAVLRTRPAEPARAGLS